MNYSYYVWREQTPRKGSVKVCSHCAKAAKSQWQAQLVFYFLQKEIKSQCSLMRQILGPTYGSTKGNIQQWL